MTARKIAKKGSKKGSKKATKKIAKKAAAKPAKKSAPKSTKKTTTKTVAKRTATKKSPSPTPTRGKFAKTVLSATAFDAASDAASDPTIGLTRITADKLGDGFGSTQIRADLLGEYNDAMAMVRALGGVLTSSGAIRDLSEPATPGRSRTSFHYTGRAFDLWIGTGMQGTKDRYLVQRAGGTDANPEWEIRCTSETPDTTSPLFDASLITTSEVEFLVWKKGTLTLQKRTVTSFSLTSVLKKFGWVNIPARAGWPSEYLCAEWWHFQHHKGLVEGKSLFGDELRSAWKSALVAKSGLALNAVFKGRSFRI